MLTGVEFVREECKKKRISIAQLERDLGFSNGYLNPKKLHKIPYDRARMISSYLGIDINQVLGNAEADEKIEHHEHYTDPETAKIAQEIFDDSYLHALFRAARGSKPKDVQMVTEMLNRFKGTNPDG